MGLTACGAKEVSEPAAEQTAENASTVEEKKEEVTAEAESTSAAENQASEESGNYIEDLTISAVGFTMNVPEKLKGKFYATVEGNEISIFDKESVDGGYPGFVFSVVADTENKYVPGGMYVKVGEFLTADGSFYNICKGYASEIQWDYNKEEMPANFKELFDGADEIISACTGNDGNSFMYGAGTKGEELYTYTVSRYLDAFSEGWDANKFEEEGMSPEFYALYKNEGERSLDKIGFAYKDVSNDGVDELLVGIINESNEPSVVYDIYTTVDKNPTLVVSGTARNHYLAYEYGGIVNVFSESAQVNGINSYIIEPGSAELSQQVSLKYDTATDEKNPWFVSYDGDTWESMTEEDYNSRLTGYTDYCLKLDFTPFSEIAPIDYSKVDLSKYDTFTKMLDDFKKGMGYANVKVGDTDVFLISEGTYNGENNTQNAIDASVLMYNEKGAIIYLGKIQSTGTAYPISISDGKLYTGGHHFVKKYTVDGLKLVTAEEALEQFDTSGNSTFYYAEGGAEATTVADDTNLTRMFDEYSKAEPIDFSVEKP